MDVSIDRITAWAWGLVCNLACNIPEILISLVYFTRPVTLSHTSTLWTLRPTVVNFSIRLTPFLLFSMTGTFMR